MELWYTERQTPHAGITCKVKETLYTKKTAFQELAILDTHQFGRMLVLDGMVQATEADEFIYHEMIAHVPLNTHPHPQRVLVIGGGDGGTLREVMKHREVTGAVLVEIDQEVVAACREYLPGLSCGLEDGRAEIVYGDGIQYVKKLEKAFDVVLVDSPEPVGPAAGLFSEDFYRNIYNALKPGGILVAQTESPFFNGDLIRSSYRNINKIFPLTRLYLASIPTYPSGLWSFTLGSRGPEPLQIHNKNNNNSSSSSSSINSSNSNNSSKSSSSSNNGKNLNTRYYNPQVHHSAFSLPGFVRELLQEGE